MKHLIFIMTLFCTQYLLAKDCSEPKYCFDDPKDCDVGEFICKNSNNVFTTRFVADDDRQPIAALRVTLSGHNYELTAIFSSDECSQVRSYFYGSNNNSS